MEQSEAYEFIKKKQEFSIKIALLRQKLPPAKRPTHVRVKSENVINPAVKTRNQKNQTVQNLAVSAKTEQVKEDPTNSLKLGCLRFNIGKDDKDQGKISNHQWTLQNWMVPRSSSLIVSNKKIRQKPCEDLPTLVPQQKTQPAKRVIPKDGQALLRRNSLYRNSFVKSLEKKQPVAPHIGGTPLPEEKVINSGKKQRYKTQRKQRQNNYISKLKLQSLQKLFIKQSELLQSLHPEPW